MTVDLRLGDCIEVMRTLPDNSVDAVVTDPPYGLEFMGKEWDAPWKASSVGRGARVSTERASEMTAQGKGHTTSAGPYLAARVDSTRIAGKPFQDWCEQWASECLRVLKPGGHMLAFGGTRTWHRLAAAVEDAGFEVRDSIAWLYGSGFPKSLDVSKAIDKAAGATREVVGVHHRNGGGSATSDSMSGPLGTDSELPRTAPATAAARQFDGWGTALKPAFEPIVVARKPLAGTVAANVLAHGTGALNIDGTRVEAADQAMLDAAVQRMSGNQVRGDLNMAGSNTIQPKSASGRWPANVLLDGDQADQLDAQTGVLTSGKMRPLVDRTTRQGDAYGQFSARTATETYGDSGGASRFFPTFRYQAKAPTSERPKVDGVAHPTVKPLALMQWLVRLVTPPGGTVLEPFAGSGTTAEAAVLEGFQCIAIEQEADYLPLILDRLARHQTADEGTPQGSVQLNLFDGDAA